MGIAFGTQLQQHRERQGLSLASLSRKVGCVSSHLLRIENGESLPSLPLFVRISRVLSLDERAIANLVHAVNDTQKAVA